MQIIKLDAIDSTNQYLKDRCVAEELHDFTVVMAVEQTNGRGQRGTVWHSEKGKNLTFSILKKNIGLPVHQQFLINAVVSLALHDMLTSFMIPCVTIKWPNDILSGHFKICGILIENTLSGNILQNSVIGIGLNVNQTHFDTAFKASSLKKLTGNHFVLDELLQAALKQLKNRFEMIAVAAEGLYAGYENRLFRKNKPSTFQDAHGKSFMGFIKGVDAEGKLMVTLEDGVQRTFGLKEVKLLY